MDHQQMFVDELRDISRRFPGFRIRTKSGSLLCRFLSPIVSLLTLGRSRFMRSYHTLLGRTLYTGDAWNHGTWGGKWMILRHERAHLEQMRRCGLGSFWLGCVLWSFSYLFLLPALWTLRARWEREAYAETVRAHALLDRALDQEWLARQFTTSAYFWMWPRPKRIHAWISALMEREGVRPAP